MVYLEPRRPFIVVHSPAISNSAFLESDYAGCQHITLAQMSRSIHPLVRKIQQKGHT